MDKVFAAKRVATKLRSAEAFDRRGAGRSVGTGARNCSAPAWKSGLAANVGDVALTKIMAAMSALSEARTSMVAGHAELAEAAAAPRHPHADGRREDKAEPAETAELREVA